MLCKKEKFETLLGDIRDALLQEVCQNVSIKPIPQIISNKHNVARLVVSGSGFQDHRSESIF